MDTFTNRSSYLTHPAKLAKGLILLLDEAPVPSTQHAYMAATISLYTHDDIFHVRRDHAARKFVVTTESGEQGTLAGVAFGVSELPGAEDYNYGQATIRLSAYPFKDISRFVDALNPLILIVEVNLVNKDSPPEPDEDEGTVVWRCEETCAEMAAKQRRAGKHLHGLALRHRDTKRRAIIRGVTDAIHYSPPGALLPHGGVGYQEAKERFDSMRSPPVSPLV